MVQPMTCLVDIQHFALPKVFQRVFLAGAVTEALLGIHQQCRTVDLLPQLIMSLKSMPSGEPEWV